MFDMSYGRSWQCFNPTEAGGFNAAFGDSSDLSLMDYYANGGNVLATRVRAMNWLAPGQTGGDGCVSSVGVSDVWFTKRVEIGAEGVTNAIRFEALVHMESARENWTLQAPVVFGRPELSQFFSLDPATGDVAVMPMPLNNESMMPALGRRIPLMTTPDYQHALAVFSPEAVQQGQYQAGYWQSSDATIGAHVGYVHLGGAFPAKGYLKVRSYVVVGNLWEVIAAVEQLYAIAPPKATEYGRPF